MPEHKQILCIKHQRYDSTGGHPHQVRSFGKEAVKPPALVSRMNMCMAHSTAHPKIVRCLCLYKARR